MVHILVRLSVSDFGALKAFETEAVAVMKSYGGEFLTAFELERASNGTGTEVHVLQFPDLTQFEAYRQDPRLSRLSELRTRAIAGTEVAVSRRIKHYGASGESG